VKIVVFSDSHGDYHRLWGIVQLHINDTDIFMHLGDGRREFLEIVDSLPEKKMLSVPGNCDIGAGAAASIAVLDVCGKRILYTHGHTCRVKDGLDILRERALAQNADMALFGHTHNARSHFDGRLYMFNPGSLIRGFGGVKPTYGIIEIFEDEIRPAIITL